MNLALIGRHLWFLETVKFCFVLFAVLRFQRCFFYIMGRRLFLALSLIILTTPDEV